jgi:hypothetical protein
MPTTRSAPRSNACGCVVKTCPHFPDPKPDPQGALLHYTPIAPHSLPQNRSHTTAHAQEPVKITRFYSKTAELGLAPNFRFQVQLASPPLHFPIPGLRSRKSTTQIHRVIPPLESSRNSKAGLALLSSSQIKTPFSAETNHARADLLSFALLGGVCTPGTILHHHGSPCLVFELTKRI